MQHGAKCLNVGATKILLPTNNIQCYVQTTITYNIKHLNIKGNLISWSYNKRPCLNITKGELKNVHKLTIW